MLTEKSEELKKVKKYNTESGTVNRVFEMHENCEKNENGEIPVFAKPEVDKQKKRLN